MQNKTKKVLFEIKPERGEFARVKLLRDNTLRYEYGNNDFSCCFSLFCEVGEKWKTCFNSFFKKYNVKTIDLESKPWCADVLT